MFDSTATDERELKDATAPAGWCLCLVNLVS
jgi:hypothetical protein